MEGSCGLCRHLQQPLGSITFLWRYTALNPPSNSAAESSVPPPHRRPALSQRLPGQLPHGGTSLLGERTEDPGTYVPDSENGSTDEKINWVCMFVQQTRSVFLPRSRQGLCCRYSSLPGGKS